mgnify:CR=1 FL=1
MTANAFEEDRKHALQLGMNEHLAKPVDIEKLKDVFTKYFNHERGRNDEKINHILNKCGCIFIGFILVFSLFSIPVRANEGKYV